MTSAEKKFTTRGYKVLYKRRIIAVWKEKAGYVVYIKKKKNIVN